MASKLFLLQFLLTFCFETPANAYPPMSTKTFPDSTNLPTPDVNSRQEYPGYYEPVLELEHLKSIPGRGEKRQSETDTTESPFDFGQREEEEPSIPQHRAQTVESPSNPSTLNMDTSSSNEKPSTKPFYGAARLAFGQNPEIIATVSTTSTMSSSLSPSSSFPVLNANNPTSFSTTLPTDEDPADNLEAELQATKNAERRSLNVMLPKTAESLLRRKDGQYSSFDMAQYVFWTGDEAGVARAVEEFIQQGLMSRENAIKFLKDIRVGIDYLKNSYNNRILPMQAAISAMNTPAAITTVNPPTIVSGKKSTEPEQVNSTPDLQKAFDGIPSLFKLQEITNSLGKDNNNDYDDVAGRMRLADFLYAEYSLEEVIYQLAKVMFSQSLTNGSEQSQMALQRLTEFLEAEGEHGRMSPHLQKKILDVLLAALAQTLAEHPELLAAARSGLGNVLHKLPHNKNTEFKH